jgi:hypothetical protein
MEIKQKISVRSLSAFNVLNYESHSNQSNPEHQKFNTYIQNHEVTFIPINDNDNYYSYTDKITNPSTNPPESYEISGVVKQSKDGNKVTLDFNGTGYKTTTYTHSDGKKAEATYKVYSKMQGELCKNGNIKIILDEENGETNNAKIDGQEVVFNDLYSSESNFCLKKVK